MANPVHLEKLCEGPRAWNEWREANPYVVPDLSQATLSLNQRQLGPSNGGPIDLRAANLEGAVLRFATLTEADLEGASLRNADLLHARLDGARLIAADLTDAMLDHADLTGSHLTRAVVSGASFTSARNLTQGQMDQAFGDATTLLPAILTPPQSWFAPLGSDDVFPEYPVFGEEEEDDLYALLGVPDTAQLEEIRAAHRTLVKKLHPDLNPGDEAAQERFKKVSNAYRILGDPEKRSRYDKGEIDSEGRVRPEFEAQQEFRKYAFRFYAAAVVAACVALGALAFVWHQVLRANGEGARSATAAPKQSGRLTALAPQKLTVGRLTPANERAKAVPPQEEARAASPGKTAVAVPPEENPPSQSEPQGAARPASQPGQDEAVKAANLEPGPPKSEAAGRSANKKGANRPLGKAHKKGRAGEAEASSAGSSTAESGGEAQASRAPQDPQTASEGRAAQQTIRVYMRTTGQDPVSALFRARAIEQTMAKDPSQTTASIPSNLFSQDRAGEVEGQARPTAGPYAQTSPGAAKQGRTPAFIDRRARRNQRPPVGLVAGPRPADFGSSEQHQQHSQAVSAILSGGL